MNNQEQELRSAETPALDRRPINTDPREQPQPQMGQFSVGMQRPQTPVEQPFGMAPRPRRGHSRWYWMGVGFLIVVVILGSLTVASFLATTTVTETKTFSVGNQPTLVLNDGNGDVHVVSGPANQITVVAHKRVYLGDSSQVPIHYQQSGDGNTVTVTVDDNSFTISFFSLGIGASFDVTVPSQTNLNLKSGNGSLDARGVSGQIELHSGNGSVSTNNGSGQITLTSGNGSVDASNVSGKMTMESGNGSVTVVNGRASGNSTFQSGNGAVSYSGSLDPHGSYLLKSGNGSVDITLPRDSAFRLLATTGNGSIDINFPGLNNHIDRGTLNVSTPGSGPFAQLTLDTGNGSIHLNAQG